jgi:Holliday junction resolvase RusA-like endonuclease
MKFYVRCNPPKATSQMRKIVRFKDKAGNQKTSLVPNAKSAAAKRSLYSMFLEHSPEVAFVGPVRLSIAFVWPWRASETKGNIKKFSDKRPDADNLAKIATDALMDAGYFARDDSQVASLHVVTGWGGKHGIFIGIEELNEESVTATLWSLINDY